MKNKKTYNGNLNISENVVSVDTDINYQAIELDYVGNINISSLLPNNYIINYGNNKIIIVKTIKNNNIVEELFSYVGMAMITKCMLVTDNLETYNLYIDKSELELYQRLDGSYENYTRNWEDLDFDGINNKKPYIFRKTSYDEEAKTFNTIKEIRKK